MKRFVIAILALTLVSGCSSIEKMKARKAERESYQNPFYVKYLDPESRLDQQIYARVESLRENADNPVVHNELGALLFERDFPKDARQEFEWALDLDKKFYPARFNLGLVHLGQGHIRSAERAFKKVVSIKPGHPEAQFYLGLVYEMQGRKNAAVEHYAKAFSINWAMLDPQVNPRIVDATLKDRALLQLYEQEHAKGSARFTGPHRDYVYTSAQEEAPTPEVVE